MFAPNTDKILYPLSLVFLILGFDLFILSDLNNYFFYSHYININLEWSRNESATVKLLNASGKEVAKKYIQLVKGANFIKLDDLSKLPAGIYFIEVVSPEEKVVQQILK